MNRLEWVLGILLVVLLLVVIGVSALLWLQPRATDVPEGYVQTTAVSGAVGAAPTSAVPGKTAKIAYAIAQRGVVDWYADAVLLDASTTWPQGATETDLRTGAANWGYTFYSPDAGTAALVTVTGDTAKRVSENPYSPPASTIADAGAWLLDSQQAVQIFLDNGGAAFMRDNGTTTMIMQLTTSNPGGRLEWFVSLFGNENGRSFSMRIDATSGEVLETIDTQ